MWTILVRPLRNPVPAAMPDVVKKQEKFEAMANDLAQANRRGKAVTDRIGGRGIRQY